MRRAQGPLRRVVGYYTDERGLEKEVYECGHIRLPKSDHMGETYAARRRCGACFKGRPPHLSPQQLAGYQPEPESESEERP